MIFKLGLHRLRELQIIPPLMGGIKGGWSVFFLHPPPALPHRVGGTDCLKFQHELKAALRRVRVEKRPASTENATDISLPERVGTCRAGGLSPARCRPHLSSTTIGEGIGATFLPKMSNIFIKVLHALRVGVIGSPFFHLRIFEVIDVHQS